MPPSAYLNFTSQLQLPHSIKLNLTSFFQFKYVLTCCGFFIYCYISLPLFLPLSSHCSAGIILDQWVWYVLIDQILQHVSNMINACSSASDSSFLWQCPHFQAPIKKCRDVELLRLVEALAHILQVWELFIKESWLMFSFCGQSSNLHRRMQSLAMNVNDLLHRPHFSRMVNYDFPWRHQLSPLGWEQGKGCVWMVGSSEESDENSWGRDDYILMALKAKTVVSQET